MKEVWKIIDEFPDYKVSNLGRIQSKRHKYDWKEMHPSYAGVSNHRYPVVQLRSNSVKRKSIAISTLVATYFLEGYTGGCVKHIDGDPFNNRVDNLKCFRPSNNSRKSVELDGVIYPSIKRAYTVASTKYSVPNYNSICRQLRATGRCKNLDMQLV